jgi:phosphomannomutase
MAQQPMSLKIGPFGVRGVIGESLTPQLVTGFAAAFGTYCGAGPILVGTDTRPSAEMVKQAVIAGLLSVGCTPVDVGVVPVPSLMLHVREAGAFGGLYVGGSDSSPGWSALKFISSEGLTLRANQAAELVDLYHQGGYPRVRALEVSDLRTDATTTERHRRAVVNGVDLERIRARRFRVAVDPRAGAASVPTPELLQALGCNVVAVESAGSGSFGERAELEESALSELRDRVLVSEADIGFAQDADGDRLAVVDETGRLLEADMPLVLVVQRWLARRAAPVVASASTSRAIDDAAAPFGCRVHRCRAGEASVLETMIEHGAEVGGESDGGVIVRPINACRDSFAAMAVILEAMAVSGSSPSLLRASVPRYAMVREQLLCPARDIAPSLRLIKSLFSGERVDLTDGVKVTWPDRWLLARASVTDPVIALAAEAPTEAEARALVNGVLEVLSPGA